MPKELIELVDHWKGRTLFADTDHPWHVKRVDQYEVCPLLKDGKLSDLLSSPTRFVDLEHGRCLAYTKMQRRARPEDQVDQLPWITEWWVVVGTPVAFTDPERGEQHVLAAEDTLVVATGIEDFVERLVEAKGRYYFDEPGFTPPRSLRV
jgi:hypothetical protein